MNIVNRQHSERLPPGPYALSCMPLERDKFMPQAPETFAAMAARLQGSGAQLLSPPTLPFQPSPRTEDSETM
eukprot:301447-Pyramimonas_sp.AAC.1